MQVFLNTQNSNYNSHQTFKGILVKNKGMKEILTRRDIAELKKVNTRKVSLMCMQEATEMAEYKFFELHPECKIDGMKKLIRNAIRKKALELLNSTNERKEIDFEVVPTHDRIDGWNYYYTDFYSYNFPIPFIVGYGKDALNKDEDIYTIKDRFGNEDSESLENNLNFHTSTEGCKDFSFAHGSGYEYACYNELVTKNDEIKSLLKSPLFGKIELIEELKKEIKETADSTKEVPKLAKIPVIRGHYEEISDEFGTERVWVRD